MEKFKNFLSEIAPYVVLVGSYGRNEENEHSDLDFYIRRRTEEEIENDWNEFGDAEEHYMKQIIDIVKKYEYDFGSVIVGHIAVEEDVPCMVELSYHYKIPKNSKIFVRSIYGISILCAEDDKSAANENCYDYTDYDDKRGDFVNIHPLPEYSVFIEKSE